ncbi:zinc transporter ZntB [Mesobaculum littorinae]|uniref:Zinc transporter ZntB n=1 Tax=Mesobaculum littorinae TaxID=2486419 RepID=A0A438ACW9_9RHOB|nr:zinc transporter ZntB [Mesobaculum littorinae]RVV96529.1 zinc transporter ZntB [Mesobaculum littorinae]
MTRCIHFAYALAGDTPGRTLTGDDEIADALAAPEPAWIHMQADDARTRDWIETHLAYLPEPVRAALLATDPRPRAVTHGDGVLVILRGVNLNPGAEPEDMISIRLWVAEGRIVSVSLRELASVHEMAAAIAAGQGPQRAGTLLCDLAERLQGRIETYVQNLDDLGDRLEVEVLQQPGPELRATVTDTRGEIVDLRRFLLPQRDAAAALAQSPAPVLDDHDRLRLSEVQDRLLRAVEEVEGLRERLVVVKDELTTAMSDRLNRNLYLLSVISAVFLPLGVLTGLMGINLAGMPGANWPPAFWVFTGLLCLILAAQVALLRRLNWL